MISYIANGAVGAVVAALLVDAINTTALVQTFETITQAIS